MHTYRFGGRWLRIVRGSLGGNRHERRWRQRWKWSEPEVKRKTTAKRKQMGRTRVIMALEKKVGQSRRSISRPRFSMVPKCWESPRTVYANYFPKWWEWEYCRHSDFSGNWVWSATPLVYPIFGLEDGPWANFSVTFFGALLFFFNDRVRLWFFSIEKLADFGYNPGLYGSCN